MRARHPVTTAAVLIAVIAGCGGDAGDGVRPSRSLIPVTTPVKEIPGALAGTWRTTFPVSEISGALDELGGASPVWRLEIVQARGAGDASALTYVNEAVGVIGRFEIEVSGDRLTLADRRCGGGSTYVYAIVGRSLTFETIRSACPRTVVEAVLTARPWRAAGSYR